MVVMPTLTDAASPKPLAVTRNERFSGNTAYATLISTIRAHWIQPIGGMAATLRPENVRSAFALAAGFSSLGRNRSAIRNTGAAMR